MKTPKNQALTILKGFSTVSIEISRLSPEGLGVAAETIERFVARAVRLYEQEPQEAFTPSDSKTTGSDGSGGCLAA